MVRVSIVMASYNRKDFIIEAVDSILKQTYKDFEFIIIDDCSTDGTTEILEEYAQKDCRIKLIKNIENKGLIYNLRLGFEIAEGEYILRMDDDDVAYLERIEKQVKFMDENPEITVCGSFIELIGDCENSIGWVKHYSAEEISILLNFFNPMCHPSVIIRKSFLKKHNINYRFEALHAEEYDLWKQIIFHDGKISNIPEILLKYRIHKNRISQAENSAKIQNETAKKVKAEMLSRFFNKREVNNIVKNIYMYPFEKNDKYRLYSLLKKMIIKDRENVLDKNAMSNIIKKYCNGVTDFSVFNVTIYKNFLQKIFSIRNSYNKKHKIITLLGIKIKINRKAGGVLYDT